MKKGFEYPSYFFMLIDFLCRFVISKKETDSTLHYKSCDSFADFFACVFVTQAIEEPSYEDIYDQLIKVYGEFILPLSHFAIKYGEELGLEKLEDFIFMIQKAQQLERQYNGDFSEFIKTFGSSQEMFKFVEKYFGIDHLIRTDEMLFMLSLFHSDHARFRSVVQGFSKMKMMRHPYDKLSYKFILETIASNSQMHVNYVALLLDVHVKEWMKEAKLIQIKSERI